jgi:hypothetical protein
LVVAWTSSDQSGTGIFGRLYGERIFDAGFESGGLDGWSATSTDGFDLSVTGDAAMAGTTAGLEAVVDDTNPLFVQDDTPNGETRYRARFLLDSHDFDPGEASGHLRSRIFIAFDRSALRVFTLVLKRQDGGYSVAGRVRRDDGTRADTGFFPITDGPHSLEVKWRRASAPGAMDGTFTLLVDNVVVSVLVGLDNHSKAVDFVRLGAMSLKAGASGTLFFDEFESRRKLRTP